jgi:hypothetical protein
MANLNPRGEECVKTYDAIAEKFEQKERDAGIAVGSWRTMNGAEWATAIMGGHRKRAREESLAGLQGVLDEARRA